MKVLYDHQIFSLQSYGGISRYFYYLLEQAKTDNDIKIIFPLYYSDNIYLQNLSLVQAKSYAHWIPFELRKYFIRHANKKNQKNVIEQLLKEEIDIFHPTYYDLYFLPYLSNIPLVITIHDMIPEKYPDLLPDMKNIVRQKQLLIEKAAMIIAVSHSTKKDLMKFYSIDENKIHVIYHGVDFPHQQNSIAGKLRLRLPENFILYVGQRYNYKNFIRLLNAFAGVTKEMPEIHLVCAGGKPFDANESLLIHQLGLRGKVLQYHVNDSILTHLYKRAQFLVFPSLCEGFGLPILEAFYFGCPVVLSDIAVFKEVAGEAALYFDPFEEEDIKDKILRFLRDEHLRKNCSRAGKLRVRDFSWNKTWQKTREVYQQMLTLYSK